MSRTQATENAYIKRAQGLMARAWRELSASAHSEPFPEGWVRWLIAQKPNWTGNTWRQNKASVTWMLKFIQSRPDASEALRESAVRAECRLASESQAGTLKHSDKTSGRRAKQAPDEAYMRLLETIYSKRDEWAWALLAVDWLRATEVTGLRPVEWRDAELIRNLDSEAWLEVKNAKSTNLRGNGATRRLLLSPNDPNAWHVNLVSEMTEHLARARVYATFEECYSGVRHCIRRANRLIESARRRSTRPGCKPGKPITLYSLRHRFVADSKASGLSQVEIAALLGHSSADTAGRHYARRVTGRSCVGVTPDPSQVASVKPSRRSYPAKNRPMTINHPSSGT